MSDTDEAEGLELAQRLEALAADPNRLAAVGADVRERLFMAAGRLTWPGRKEARARAKARRRKDREAVEAADEAVLARTGIREARRAPVYRTPRPSPELLAEPPAAEPAGAATRLREPRKCYVCK